MGFLQYSFIETVANLHIYYVVRALGGILYLGSALLMVYNVYKTIKSDELAIGTREVQHAPA
jgi:cytochrome c oxidase cbb3-type subunit 1